MPWPPCAIDPSSRTEEVAAIKRKNAVQLRLVTRKSDKASGYQRLTPGAHGIGAAFTRIEVLHMTMITAPMHARRSNARVSCFAGSLELAASLQAVSKAVFLRAVHVEHQPQARRRLRGRQNKRRKRLDATTCARN